jgi:hypothetical protein
MSAEIIPFPRQRPQEPAQWQFCTKPRPCPCEAPCRWGQQALDDVRRDGWPTAPLDQEPVLAILTDAVDIWRRVRKHRDQRPAGPPRQRPKPLIFAVPKLVDRPDDPDGGAA